MADFGITEWRSDELMSITTVVTLAAMKKATFLVNKDVKESLKSPGKGPLQTRYSSGRSPTGKVRKRVVNVSLPGDPPALDLGPLLNSIQSLVITERLVIDGFIYSTLEYALPLELGTTNMRRRPFLRPALKRNRKKILKIFKEANG